MFLSAIALIKGTSLKIESEYGWRENVIGGDNPTKTQICDAWKRQLEVSKSYYDSTILADHIMNIKPKKISRERGVELFLYCITF